MEEVAKPLRTSVEWSDYVLGLFAQDELVETDKGSFPNVSGLRRVAELLVGEIIESGPEECNVYTFDHSHVGRADCLYKIVFSKENLGGFHGELSKNSIVIFKGFAGASVHNLSKGYNIYPEAMAETRAEARALRKALGLKVCSAEELQDGMSIDNPLEPSRDYATPQQKAFLNTKCPPLNISFNKLLEIKDEKEFERLDKEFVAQKIKEITGYQNNRESIPETIKQD